ncbi:MAG TPA: thioredoxin domain-containing protein [Gemmatimonadaceae bacterium]|nr:thioredoxin domain-containing protein [Gemmatimonadaceae bacterium]
MPNRLAKETSPYLLQHAHNPVDWYPWGEEALERARREDKPILLSIGYAACHWCHVMERESFEDDGTAALMNARFVNVKVDREERPDIDSIYMQAVQAMTGHGGWPMTMFLTPDGTPFYGGTYFPKTDRHGMPSFKRILTSVADAYASNREGVARTTESVREMYASTGMRSSTGGATPDTLTRATAALAAAYDHRHPGFGDAPKFPPSMSLEFLLAVWARTGSEQALTMTRDTFLAMARGGIYDQIGGGLSRYSVDAEWLVPHFEKMLYDNALFVRLGVHLWQATQDSEVRAVVEDTIEWLRREMTSPAGGFHSSLDADSEGHEGKYYVWSSAEFDAAASEAGATADELSLLRRQWSVTEAGNFEGANILNVTYPQRIPRLRELRQRLYEIRERRVRPGRDDKMLAGWNGLMTRAIAEAARAFGRGDHEAMAIAAGEFLFRERVQGDRVFRSSRGTEPIPGVLEDQAGVGLAALSLYELTFDRRWLDRAVALSKEMIAAWWDEESKSFYDTAVDHEKLIVRPRDVTDNALPAGNSLACELLARIGILMSDDDARRIASAAVDSLAEPMARHPLAFGHLLGVADMLVNGSVELALVGKPGDRSFDELARAAGQSFVPALIIAGGSEKGVALLADRPMVGGKATAYVCRSFACEAPTTSPAELARQLSTVTYSGRDR